MTPSPTKHCPRCNQDKTLDQFYWDGRGPTKLYSSCKPCHNWLMKESRIRNTDTIREYAKTRTRKLRTLTDAAKDVPCADCGIKYMPYVMDFDHLPQHKKSFKISERISRPLEVVKAEIEKCEVVCANCHRIRTYNRKMRIKANGAA